MKQRLEGFTDKLYRFWYAQVDENESSFYRDAIKNAGGTALEIGASGGRLLLKFLSEGLLVEGVESAPSMISLIASRASKMSLTPKVYHQSIDHLDLKGPYGLIYIPLGSFQFIVDLLHAKNALLQYHALLQDGGKLIIPLYLPFGDIPQSILGKWVITSDIKDKHRKIRIIKREITWHDAVEQMITSKVRIEYWSEKDLLEMVEKEISIRWYSKGEFEALLGEAGFTSITCARSYAPNGLPIPSLMLFIAKR